jgi:hypothetical protein
MIRLDWHKKNMTNLAFLEGDDFAAAQDATVERGRERW